MHDFRLHGARDPHIYVSFCIELFRVTSHEPSFVTITLPIVCLFMSIMCSLTASLCKSIISRLGGDDDEECEILATLNQHQGSVHQIVVIVEACMPDSHVTNIGPVECVRWCPDGTSFASGSDDKTIMVWRRLEGKGLVCNQMLYEVNDAMYSDNGSALISRRIFFW